MIDTILNNRYRLDAIIALLLIAGFVFFVRSRWKGRVRAEVR